MTEQEQSFRAYLSKQTTNSQGKEKHLSENTIKNCIRFVSNTSKISVFFAEADIPFDGQTLLSISDSATLNQLAKCWPTSNFKKSSNDTNRAAMNHFFKWHGISPNSIAKEPTHISTAILPTKQIYPTPYHAIRFLQILQAFCGKKKRGQARQPELYTKFLTAFFGDNNSYILSDIIYSDANFQEIKPNSRTFFANCLAYFADETELECRNRHNRLITAYPDFSERCNALAQSITKSSGDDLLQDLSRKSTSYDDSLLPALEALHSSSSTEAYANALATFLQRVLQDWSPNTDPQKKGIIGEVFDDPRFYTGKVLSSLFFQKWYSSWFVELILHLPSVIDSLPTELCSELCKSLYPLVQTCPAYITDRYTPYYIYSKSNIPEREMLGAPFKTIYAARLQLNLAKVAYHLFKKFQQMDPDHPKMIYLTVGEVAIDSCIKALDARSAAKHSVIEIQAKVNTMQQLRNETITIKDSLRTEWNLHTSRTHTSQLSPKSNQTPIYSSVFDSVYGTRINQQRNVEKTFFRTMMMAQNPLLQFNQIVDNRAILNLFHVPGFRLCCKQGLVLGSGYGSLNTPTDYLLAQLQNPNYIFSSTDLFNVDASCPSHTLNQKIRTSTINYLTGGGINLLDFPSEHREALEQQLDCYRLMQDCFMTSDLNVWYQSNRTTHKPRSLSQVLDSWLGSLRADTQYQGSHIDVDLLSEMEFYAKKWASLGNRSAYNRAIAEARRTATADHHHALYMFQKVVDISYYISNGQRSCDSVLLTDMNDERLFPRILPSSNLIASDDEITQTIDFIFSENDRASTNATINWFDIFELAKESSAIDAADYNAPVEVRAKEKTRSLGIEFNVSGETSYPCAFSYETSEKEQRSVTEANLGSADDTIIITK